MRPRSFSDEELLDTAKRMFLESGPGLSTSRIAEALGVSQAALFKRFSTKKELMFRALAPKVLPGWIERVAEGPDERPVPDQLRNIVQDMDDFFKSMMPALSVLKASGVALENMLKRFPGGPPPVRAHEALTAFFTTLHEQGRAHVPQPRATALVFMGAVSSRHNLCHMLGDQAPDIGENYSDHMVEFIWAGMKPD